MKKTYMQPNSKVVLVKMENQLLENSLNDNKSGNDDLAKDDMYDMFDKEGVFGW